jgi:hypothetical protein
LGSLSIIKEALHDLGEVPFPKLVFFPDPEIGESDLSKIPAQPGFMSPALSPN